MVAHGSLHATQRSDARVCWSAVLLLHGDKEFALMDRELAAPLQEFLQAVASRLETDREVPRPVRRAAAQLATHVVRRGSDYEPASRDGDDGSVRSRSPGGRFHGSDRAADVPFTQSIRLGRMG
jgi:hypothetical protein